MSKASILADALGRKSMSDAVGVGLTAISNAVIRGWFPSSWFLAVKELADQKGVECPPDLFRMRTGTPQNVNAPAASQGEREGNAA
jgi:hypothetical protein